ncbi:Pre-mRNA-splicing factor syf2 [Gracilariopsis chorda]|uniref:Pre-mRNA-splicing factor SYF2 n=1 Tax=Gracilariopsis chorda TaxID=448386 RepID=A0A2V3IW61_9FLOR|nr:Pre-mRNA-splicing factor syf2 [Gracilariopsis chorda]|eukprot:PXF46384.1 Pre-mRNA-splicing factor syf2 [Gracilariopsis chorda]
MASAGERLKELRKQLAEAREENLKAVDYEEHQKVEDISSSPPRSEEIILLRGENHEKRRMHDGGDKSNRHIDVGSADEAEEEENDERLRGMKRRAKAMELANQNNPVPVISNDDTVVAYGTVTDQKEGVDRMVGELEKVERRRAKYRRRRTFDEDRSDISFINEGNRLFNRTLDKHFDKFDSVKKIKDSLERGTA